MEGDDKGSEVTKRCGKCQDRGQQDMPWQAGDSAFIPI